MFSVFISVEESSNAVLNIYSLDGKLVSSNAVSLNRGANSILAERPSAPSMYIISLVAKGKALYNNRLAAF